MFWRNPTAAFFNFGLPLLFLALFGAIFSGDQENLDVIVPGIAGMSIMATTFNALTNAAIQIAIVVLAGKLFFHLGWPKDWLELAVFTVAGVICLGSLGIAY